MLQYDRYRHLIEFAVNVGVDVVDLVVGVVVFANLPECALCIYIYLSVLLHCFFLVKY